jgi:hypothetical protein
MGKESKILIGIMAVLILALPLMSCVMATEDNGPEPDGSDDFSEEKAKRFLAAAYKLHQGRLRSLIWFFRGAEKDMISGTVTARHRNILIVTVDDGERYNIVLPMQWNLGSEVISLDEMFEEGHVGLGDDVTLKVLKKTVENENEVALTAIFGYEIEDVTTGSILYAVLPFNIDG